ncbi:homoserine O-acetyltransferase [Helicobacter sp. 16-1353]|uniref:homoserine O-acetyltransferase MetX n=1 Tax=Helicobacter sp. 16-1353 TaxID=2004996 RepID=UPI000DCB2529|nr:homoserine O-acetyltransferase [Helicobacter sp. 16-1353]RAX55189.1 homoserine O-acetyltransferase [Helicobacter sp. 16-1353]
MKIESHIAHFTNPLYLQSGRILEPYDIAYATYGELNEDKSNCILVCHALSGSQYCAGEVNDKRGWWDNLIGENKAIDTNKYYVICTNSLGSAFGSTSPISQMYPTTKHYRLKFPVITIFDMIKAQRILLNSLNITKLHAIIGGSMGGMQTLSFAIMYPNIANRFIALSTTHATSPFVIAFNKIMSEAIRNDPNFDNGNYDLTYKPILNGLKVARMTGFLQYITKNTMQKKFGRNYVNHDGLFELFGRFEIERYLEYNGDNFANTFDPMCLLYLLKAISIYDLSYGFIDLCDALKHIKNKLYLISFSGDNMFFTEEMQEIKNTMDKAGNGSLCSHYIVESDYGHDSFLVECNKYADYLQHILK